MNICQCLPYEYYRSYSYFFLRNCVEILYTILYMRKASLPSFEVAYSELFDDNLLTAQDVKNQQEFLVEKSAKEAAQLRENLKTYTLERKTPNGPEERNYRMAVLEGESENVFVGFSEYGTHARKDRLVQLLAIRALCDPDASVVFQSHTAWWQDNMNLASDERWSLARGSSQPIVDRVHGTLKSHHFLRKKDIHLVGPSLGATFATGVAGDERITTRSLTAFETPDIIQGTWNDLRKDFSKSGPNLYKNIHIGKLDTDTSTLHQGVGALAMFGMNALHPDNLFTALRLRHATHQADLLRALSVNPHMGVVRAWTAQSAISPREENIEITEAIQSYNNGRYASQVEGYELTNPFASHNTSNIPLVLAAYVRQAMKLSTPPKRRLY